MKMLYDHGPEPGQPGSFEIDHDFVNMNVHYPQQQAFSTNPVLKDPTTYKKKVLNRPMPI
jgi:hypothetical protein